MNIIFCFILLLLIIISLFVFMKENIYKKLGLPISIALIAIFFIIFSSYGVDSARYSYFYNIISTRNESLYFELSGGAVEKSFIAICMLCSVLKFGYIGVISFYSLASFFFFYLITKELNFNKKLSFLWILSFLAFCLVPYLTVMRQFLASMIILYTLIKFQPADWKRYMPLFILGFLFHHTAIILCPLIFIKNIKSFKNNRLLILLPAAGAILNLCGFWMIGGAVMKFLGINFSSYIDRPVLGGTGIVVLFLYTVFCVDIYILNKKSQNQTKVFKNNNLISFSILFFFTYMLTKGVGSTARLSYFFYIFESMPLLLFYEIITKKEEERKMRKVQKNNYVFIIISILIGIIALRGCINLQNRQSASVLQDTNISKEVVWNKSL